MFRIEILQRPVKPPWNCPPCLISSSLRSRGSSFRWQRTACSSASSTSCASKTTVVQSENEEKTKSTYWGHLKRWTWCEHIKTQRITKPYKTPPIRKGRASQQNPHKSTQRLAGHNHIKEGNRMKLYIINSKSIYNDFVSHASACQFTPTKCIQKQLLWTTGSKMSSI